MKIRSDFVTNSSSYSSVVITIQSKELADLLKAYQADTIFHELSVGNGRVSIYENEMADAWSRPPECLNELIYALIDGFNYFHDERKESSAMCQELRKRQEELTNSILSVDWEFEDDSYGEFEVDDEDQKRSFYFKRNKDGTITEKSSSKNSAGSRTEPFTREASDSSGQNGLERAQGSDDFLYRGPGRKALEKQMGRPFDQVSSVAIDGSTFVLTGDFARCGNNRETIQKRIQAKGGRVTGAVSGKTTYLVIGDLGGFGAKKLEQVAQQNAKGKNVKIIQEGDLFQALEGGA